MKLIHVHVENFGRLSGLDMDFKDGVNTVLHENGWGKSTLAAFLRVMFYGLEGGRKRELSENDRLKYKPWNQGHFAGSVEFEVNGKRYLVTRDFGEKEKDGTFRLQDAVTLIDSKDFSERLGEELFGLDRDSFERTSFIDRASLRYRGINSTIGSKVGSVSQTDDLSNYDAAQEMMKNFLNASSPKKKTGALYKLEDEIRQLEREVGKQGAVDARIKGMKVQRDQETEKLETLKEERINLQKQQAWLAENRTKALNAKRKRELEEAVTKRTQAVKDRVESFGERIPARAQLKVLSDKVEEAQRLAVSAASYEKSTESERYERLKRYFKNGLPEERELNAQIENCNGMQNDIQQRARLEEREEREKNKLDGYVLELQRIEAAKGLERAKAKQKQQKRNVLAITALTAGIFLGILTIALHLSGLLWIPAALLILAGTFVLMIIPIMRRSIQEDVPRSAEDMLRQHQGEAREQLETLRKEIQNLEKDAKEKENAIREFLEIYEISYSRADAESILYEMKNRAAEYRDLMREEEYREASRRQMQDARKRIDAETEELLREMGLCVKPDDFTQIKKWLSDAAQNLTILENEKREEELARTAKERFEKEHPELCAEDEQILSEEEMHEQEEALKLRVRELSDEETQIHETISAYNRSLEEAYEEATEISEKKERMEALKERRDAEMARYELVTKTQEYLKEAKEQFTARFMKPIKTAFDKYYLLMTRGKGDPNEFQVDANVNFFRKEEGSFHDVEAQSEGCADMIGLCIRMALLDVTYDQEKPIVIMDDPFASLDAERLAGAKDFLREISKDYQVLYLTCHEIRA